MKQQLKSLLAEKGLRPIDLARLVGVDKGTATKWDQGRIPAERVIDVERATGISRGDLRPDLYPRVCTPARARKGRS